jgi:hypothetical protein
VLVDAFGAGLAERAPVTGARLVVARGNLVGVDVDRVPPEVHVV